MNTTFNNELNGEKMSSGNTPKKHNFSLQSINIFNLQHFPSKAAPPIKHLLTLQLVYTQQTTTRNSQQQQQQKQANCSDLSICRSFSVMDSSRLDTALSEDSVNVRRDFTWASSSSFSFIRSSCVST